MAGVREVGRWRFDEGAGDTAADSSGNGNTLTAETDFTWATGAPSGGAVTLDGAKQWLSTEGPVVRTDESFSVSAWVRLDGSYTGPEVGLPTDVFALTAVSQSGPTHASFYLGARMILETDVHWCFTLSPEDGVSIEWQHAYAPPAVAPELLDTWVFIVGVSDVDARQTHVYVPTTGDHGVVDLPDAWEFWHADRGLQVGQGLFKSLAADQWPGSIGEVRVFSGVLTEQDAAALAAGETIS